MVVPSLRLAFSIDKGAKGLKRITVRKEALN